MNLLSPYLNPYLLVHYYDLKSILKSTLIQGFSIKLKSIKNVGTEDLIYGFKYFFFGFKDKVFSLDLRKSPARETLEIQLHQITVSL